MIQKPALPHVDANCPTCAAQCEEAKSKVKNLEKRLYAMTIAVTASVTMLGKEAADTLISYINTVKEVSEEKSNVSNEEDVKKVSLKPFQINNKPWWIGESNRYSMVSKVGAGEKGESFEEAKQSEVVSVSDDFTSIVVSTALGNSPALTMADIKKLPSNPPMVSFPSETIAFIDQPYHTSFELAPFGGYMESSMGVWQKNDSSTTIPAPNALLVFAFKGMFINKSRT